MRVNSVSVSNQPKSNAIFRAKSDLKHNAFQALVKQFHEYGDSEISLEQAYSHHEEQIIETAKLFQITTAKLLSRIIDAVNNLISEEE